VSEAPSHDHERDHEAVVASDGLERDDGATALLDERGEAREGEQRPSLPSVRRMLGARGGEVAPSRTGPRAPFLSEDGPSHPYAEGGALLEPPARLAAPGEE
jgi:hypothetical protein